MNDDRILDARQVTDAAVKLRGGSAIAITQLREMRDKLEIFMVNGDVIRGINERIAEIEKDRAAASRLIDVMEGKDEITPDVLLGSTVVDMIKYLQATGRAPDPYIKAYTKVD